MAVNQRLVASIGAASAALLIGVVSRWEGTVPQSYRDPVGIVTACVGHTGPELKMGQTFSKAECDEMLAADLSIAFNGINDCVIEEMTPGEKVAYTSFAFNAGTKAFCDSTLARKLNAGDHAGACAELSKWVNAKGRPLPGLVRRRAAERAICEGGGEWAGR